MKGRRTIGTAYLICCNDHVECAVLDDEKKALRKKEELAEKRFESRQYFMPYGSSSSRTDYRMVYYWHLREIPTKNKWR